MKRLLITIALTASCTLASAADMQPPNIVVILADDLGYGDIGCYGSKVNRTPNLDRLAAGGMRFTDFHSNGPMCSPTRVAFLTGLYQNRFGRRFESALNGARRDPGLPLSAITIAEVLRQTGYATGMFGKWHLGYQAPFLPTNQGFDEFRGLVSGDGDHHTQIDRSGNKDWWKDDAVVMEKGYTTDLITQHSIDFIERHQDEPFFLYIPHLAIHFPWQGPDDPPHRKSGVSYHKDKWGVIPNRSNVKPHVTAMIESLDNSVGRIVKTLERLDLSENTLVVVTSDNGGYLDYAGGFEKISDMGPLRGEKGTIHEGGHRVPAIVSWPGRIKPSICHETVMTFDLFPTFTGLAGTKTKPASKLDGIDLRPVLFDGETLPQRTLVWRMGASKAVRQGSWKLCLREKKPTELYNLSTDMGERRNLAGAEPQLVDALRRCLLDWERDVDQTDDGGDVVQIEPRPILNLPESGTDPDAIDYSALPTLKGRHAIVNPVAPGPHAALPEKIDMHDLRLNLHNYLAHYDGKLWCIWSDGPKIEDWPTQEIKYSTSEDGLTWNAARSVTGKPKQPHAFIARGLWIRDGQLLALAAHYRGKGAFGVPEQKQLELLAFRYDATRQQWIRRGKLYDNAINNFPPQRLTSGDWILTRRDSRFNVSVLIGGRNAIDDWQAFPVVRVGEVKGFRPDEPIFWPLADGQLFALFRDNGGSQRLFHSTSRDKGRNWDTPVLTNFPNASSKLYSINTSRGYRVMVLNANPSVGRREIYLAISTDGRTFTRLARLDVPSPPSIPNPVSRIEKKFRSGIASLQYPHVIEHGGHLLVALSRGKVQIEVFRLRLDDIDTLLEN